MGDPVVLLISASFGAGHDRAAEQLAWRLNAAGVATRQVDLVDLLPGGVGRMLRRAYHTQLRVAPASWDWLLAAAGRDGVTTAVARLSALAERQVRRNIDTDTAAVISTYPLASQILGQLRATGALAIPALTYLTDMSVHRLWIADGIDAHLSIHEVAAAHARGHGARDVHVTGPLVAPAFRPALSTAERMAARAQFNLPPQDRLALVLTGSWGVGEFHATARDIVATGLATPVIACGGNDAARRRLTARGVGIALGWVRDMPTLMRACDLVVQSGGGMSSLEAHASGLPLLTYRPLPGHGRMSAEALHQAGWATWVRDPVDLATALATATAYDDNRQQPYPQLARIVQRLAGIPTPFDGVPA